MKKLKRLITMLLVGTMLVFSLAACGQTEENKTVEKQSEESSGQASSDQAATKETSSEGQKAPVTTEPITISILTERHTNATNNAEDIWFFKYLEYWLAEQGYDVTIEVQQSAEVSQQVSLMLGTDSLPDLVWGITLSPADAVLYGAGEGMILDWTPYLNEETMPNLCRELEAEADFMAGSTCIDGGIYGLPYLLSRSYGGSALSYGMSDRMYVNTEWLKKCNLEVPTNVEEFLNMLRTFKTEMKLESGEEVIPLLSNKNFFEKYLWVCMGYYGADLTRYGTGMAIKGDEVVLPAYTEGYGTFIEIFKTCYEEELISQDYFTMDTTTMRGLSKEGIAGVVCDYTLGYVPDFENWVEIAPFAIGDTEEIAVSLSSTYSPRVWASAKTEYPEVLALIMDYMYSTEGMVYYNYGPKQGEDPLGLLDGWYLKEDGTVTTKLVEDGVYENMELYARQYVRSQDNVGKAALAKEYIAELAGQTIKEHNITDAITGNTIYGEMTTEYTHDDADGHWRIVSAEAMEPYLTTVRLPSVFMSEEDSLTISDLKTVWTEHVIAETAKFVTGTRSVSEIDKFYEELKSMGVEECINLYREAYETYMDSIFK